MSKEGYKIKNEVTYLGDPFEVQEHLTPGYGNLLYGLKPYHVSVTDNGVQYESELDTHNNDFADKKELLLTDGIIGPACHIDYDSPRYFTDKEKKLRDDGSIYIDISYELTGIARFDSVWVYGRIEKYFATYRYAVYVSDSFDELYEDSSKILTYLNDGYYQAQKIDFDEMFLTGKYLGIRVLMGVSPLFTGYIYDYTHANLRLGEIALFGEYLNEYEMTVTARDENGGELSSARMPEAKSCYRFGEEVSLAAPANVDGHTFCCWIVNGSMTGSGNEISISVTQDTIAQALYKTNNEDVDMDIITDGNRKVVRTLEVTDGESTEGTLGMVGNISLMDRIVYEDKDPDKSVLTAAAKFSLPDGAQHIESGVLFIPGGYSEKVKNGLFAELRLYNQELHREWRYEFEEDKYRTFTMEAPDKKEQHFARAYLIYKQNSILKTKYSDSVAGMDATYQIAKIIEEEGPIQRRGYAASDSRRLIKVDTQKVVFEGYQSHGANVFPMNLFEESKEAIGYNDVFFEIDSKRLSSMSPNMGRMWFQIDWMVTTSEDDYVAGRYSFDNQRMQAVYRYLDLYKCIGTKIELNFGWKVSKSIKDWFGFEDVDSRSPAPKDLDAYARACSALLHELIDVRGYDNVQYLTFYNEIGSPTEFETGSVNKLEHLVGMYRKVDERLIADGMRNKVKILGIEQGGIGRNYIHSKYMMENGSKYIDGYSGHSYNISGNNYDHSYSVFTKLNNDFDKPFYITEMFAMEYGSKPSADQWEGWDESYTSVLIASANTGMKAFLTWSAVGSWMPDPLNFILEEMRCSGWQIPNRIKNLENINLNYYEQSLICNYVRQDSDVLFTEWIGEDIKTAAFRSMNGHYTVVVEADNSKSERDIEIDFGTQIGENFNKFVFDPYNQNINANATVPAMVNAIRVEDKLKDTINADYAVYVYTTYAPIKQVEVSEVHVECAEGESVDLSVRLIDCDADDTVEWSITAVQGSCEGIVSDNGIYTASSNASKGDMVAVRASLKYDPNVFTVIIITII